MIFLMEASLETSTVHYLRYFEFKFESSFYRAVRMLIYLSFYKLFFLNLQPKYRMFHFAPYYPKPTYFKFQILIIFSDALYYTLLLSKCLGSIFHVYNVIKDLFLLNHIFISYIQCSFVSNFCSTVCN